MEVRYYKPKEELQARYDSGETLKFAAYMDGLNEAVLLSDQITRHNKLIAHILEANKHDCAEEILLGGGRVNTDECMFASPDFREKIGRDMPHNTQEAMALLSRIRDAVAVALTSR